MTVTRIVTVVEGQGKGWLTDHRVDRRVYKPAADQAALAAAFDLRLARANSLSFDKLWREMERLLTVAPA